MNIPLESILLIIAGFLNLTFGILVFIRSYGKKTKDGPFFSLLIISASFWALSLATFEGISVINIYTKISGTIMYLSAALIPIAFLFFATTLNEEKNKIDLKKSQIFITVGSYILISLITVIPGLVIKDFIQIQTSGKVVVLGPLYALYSLHIISFFIFSFVKLFKKYIGERDNVIKIQTRYVLAGIFITSVVGVTTNLILPALGNFNLIWFGPIATIATVIMTGFAVIKYNLWDFKLILTQILILLIAVMSLMDLVTVTTFNDFLINLISFVIIVIISFLLINRIIREADDKEKIKELANDLKKVNKRLKKLDKQKSEFVSIASHQLRTPIASLKGYSSMILEGTYGPVSKQVGEVVGRLFQSSQSLAMIIDDFLNLSRIERGKIEYTFSTKDVKPVLKQVINEITPRVEQKGLAISFSVTKAKKFIANIDAEKIHQVFSNIIDNSIKYTPTGSIKVELSKIENNILIKITDTGIGIPKGSEEDLFKKFKRLGNANGESVKGTGLGLYLAKEIINAHMGKIWAESKGKGKGSTFFIEIPSSETKKKKTNSTKTKEIVSKL